MKRPTPRDRIYDLYWYFAAERQAIFERRLGGNPGPWTQDPILQTYKFCNVFRSTDRVSQYLIREVAYHEEPCEGEDRLFQIIAFRVFSRITTWDAVRQYLGRQPLVCDLQRGSFRRALEYAKKSTGKLYTGAFILCANKAYGHDAKYLNYIDLFRDLFVTRRIATDLLQARSLREVYVHLRNCPLFGDFMAYQLSIDLNYSGLLNFCENSFTQAGPGAMRGMRKVFRDLGDYTPAETILWMVGQQSKEFARLGLTFNGLWGRPLHAIDCQGLFCEIDKYSREAAPELRSARTRIKTRFTPNHDRIRLFFPPKWHINEKTTEDLPQSMDSLDRSRDGCVQLDEHP